MSQVRARVDHLIDKAEAMAYLAGLRYALENLQRWGDREAVFMLTCEINHTLGQLEEMDAEVAA